MSSLLLKEHGCAVSRPVRYEGTMKTGGWCQKKKSNQEPGGILIELSVGKDNLEGRMRG